MSAAPVDRSYYDALGVDPRATPSEIKKAYYRVALQYHPDKNPGDAHAEARFKEVSEAYQVLSNPELRERYDRFGKDAAKDHPEVNAKELFNALFGGGKFEAYIGQLAVVAEMESAMAEGAGDAGAGDAGARASAADGTVAPSIPGATAQREAERDAQRAETMRKRVKKLTSLLIVRLQPYVEGDQQRFEEELQKEALELQDESFGPEMLETIGYVYELKSQQQLSQAKVFGLTLSNPYHYTREKAHAMRSVFSAIYSAADMQVTSQDMMKQTQKGTLDDARREQYESQIARKMMDMLWRLNKLEIETVLRDVCASVLMDDGVSAATRTRRAEAMRAVGRMFRKLARQAIAAREPTAAS